MDDKEKHLPQPYISTPFAYTKLSKNLTLLQQSMLNKVSEHLQKYIQYYYGSDLKLQTEKPRPLFSQAEKNHGLPVFLVSYAELGVGIANFNVAKKAVDEVLSLTIEAPGKDKDGNDSIVKQLVFSSANMSYNESTGIAFTLNPAVVDWVFDMSQGYVRHPADIARIGQVERMPMMYYYLFKKSEKWKNREVPLKVSEIKDYLGLLKSARKVTEEGSSRGRSLRVVGGDDTVEIKEAYPKFSQFKKNVIDTSISDINRLCYDGLLDVCVRYRPVYSGNRKVGNPSFIAFYIYDTIEEMLKATAEDGWRELLETYKGVMLSCLIPFKVFSYDGKTLTLTATKEQIMAFENSPNLNTEEIKLLRDCLKKIFGKPTAWNYKISE